MAAKRLVWSALIAVVALGAGGLGGGFLRQRFDSGAHASDATGLEANAATSVTVLDSGIEPGEYFRNVQEALTSNYQKEISDLSQLSHGALDAMLQRLSDPGSRFYPPESWSAYKSSLQGEAHGIGADLVIEPAKMNMPNVFALKVYGVTPDGNGSKAGLMPDDEIAAVGEKWLIAPPLVRGWQADQAEYASKKITIQELQKRFDVFRKRLNSGITLTEAANLLSTSGEGTTKLTVSRNGKLVELNCSKNSSAHSLVESVGETVAIRGFGTGVADALDKAIEGKTELTLDLRGNPGGDLKDVESCLSLLIPAGVYAKTQKEPKAPLTDLKISTGSDKSIRVTLLVDKGTSREAELFVSALRDRIGAKVVGGPTRGYGVGLSRISLSDGSGYTISTSRFFDIKGKSLVIEADTKTAMLPNDWFAGEEGVEA